MVLITDFRPDSICPSANETTGLPPCRLFYLAGGVEFYRWLVVHNAILREYHCVIGQAPWMPVTLLPILPVG